jgi:radical SAM protein with 4Fe4S-binding SPASM domain
MDGSPQTQDTQRPMASGKASSRWVMQTLRELEANHRPYRLRLTAMPPFDRLLEDIRFLCENTHCQRMQVEGAFNTQRGGGYQYELEQGLQFLQAFFAAQRVAEQYGRELYCVGSEVGKITAVPCGAPFNTLIVTPQNNLVGCFEVVNDSHPLAEVTTIGRITPQGVEIDEEARLRLRQKIDERRASCRECYCYWSCAGGCLPRTYSPEPNGHLEHGAHCELKRTLQREMLLKQIAAGNGLRKHTPKRSAARDVSTSARKNQ